MKKYQVIWWKNGENEQSLTKRSETRKEKNKAEHKIWVYGKGLFRKEEKIHMGGSFLQWQEQAPRLLCISLILASVRKIKKCNNSEECVHREQPEVLSFLNQDKNIIIYICTESPFYRLIS